MALCRASLTKSLQKSLLIHNPCSY